MAKKRKPQPDPVPPVIPTDAQLANGSYERKFVMHGETATQAMTYVSDHDPVERWDRAGRLSDSQRLAIAAVRRLWMLTGLSQRVTASYGERLPGGGNVEMRALNEIEARKDIHRMQDYVPKLYWDLFENVCRHGMPAGVAGLELNHGTRTAQERAHTVVCFVADVVAMKERW